jgi:hypothetical protein
MARTLAVASAVLFLVFCGSRLDGIRSSTAEDAVASFEFAPASDSHPAVAIRPVSSGDDVAARLTIARLATVATALALAWGTAVVAAGGAVVPASAGVHWPRRGPPLTGRS